VIYSEAIPTTVFVCVAFPPECGGIQRYLSTLSCELARETPVLVFAPRQEPSHVDDCYSYSVRRYGPSRPPRHRVLRGVLYIASLVLCLAKEIRRTNVSLICCGEASPAILLPALLISRITKKPFYAIAHGTDFLHLRGSIDRYLLSFSLRRVTRTLANSQVTSERLITATGVSAECVSILHPPFSQGFAKAAGEGFRGTRANSGPRLLTVARLDRRKGHDAVIRALPRILAEYPTLSYRIVGAGPQFADLRKLVSSLELERAVEFTGSVSDAELITEYQSCDIFVMPSQDARDGSDMEGFGIAYIEANLFGKPVIGARSGGTSDAIVNGVTGLLVDRDQPNTLPRAILALLGDPSLAESLGRNGRVRAQQFTPAATAARFRAITQI
jgi:phosphatidylinositol alpha-1,6-mannosyltransferase